MPEGPRPRPSLEEVRSVLGRALGDARLEGVGAEEPLLRSGLVTSIELVGILVELEMHFGVSLPDGQLTADRLTLGAIVRALAGQVASAAAEAPPEAAPVHSRNRFARRPIQAVAVAGLLFVGIDLAARELLETVFKDEYLEFLEGGRRLYPYSGYFSQDDFRFAVGQSQIATTPAPGTKTCVVLGDSGTIGSYLKAEESMPAQLERLLAASDARTRVVNLAWYGRLLPKDLMLLELVWDQHFDTVVFTVGDDLFSRRTVERWIRRYRHCSVNWPLFPSFVARVAPEDRAPFIETEGMLREADLAQGGALRRWGFEHLAVMHYGPFFQYLLTVKVLPSPVGSPMRWDMVKGREERYALRARPRDISWGLPPDDVDQRQISMLRTTIALLRRRGVSAVLYLEPCGPAEWRPARAPEATASAIAARIAEETGAGVVDLTWSLGDSDFLDSSAHYTPEASRLIAEKVAEGVRSEGGARAARR